MRFYHIDRIGSLNEGDTIKLKKYNDIISYTGDEKETFLLQNKIDEMFPNGVSSHGNQYYISSSSFLDTSADIELIFELVRRYKYSSNLSRFESFFAVDKETIPIMLNVLKCNSNVRIFEVECDEYSRHDMNLLAKSSNLVNTIRADMYWKSDIKDHSICEYLLKPPVRIIKDVTYKFI